MRDAPLRLLGASVMAVLLVIVLAASRLPGSVPENLAPSTRGIPVLGALVRSLGITTLFGLAALALAIVVILACAGSAARRNPARSWLRITAAVVLLASYPWSGIEWSRVLVFRGFAEGGVPGVQDLLAPVAAVGAALALAAAWQWRRAADGYRDKGVPEEEASHAGRMALTALGTFGLAAGATLALAALFQLAAGRADLGAVTFAMGTFLFPVLAGLGLLLLVALAARRGRPARG